MGLEENKSFWEEQDRKQAKRATASLDEHRAGHHQLCVNFSQLAETKENKKKNCSLELHLNRANSALGASWAVAGIMTVSPAASPIAPAVATATLVSSMAMCLTLRAHDLALALWARGWVRGILATGPAASSEASTVAATALVSAKAMGLAFPTRKFASGATGGGADLAKLDVREHPLECACVFSTSSGLPEWVEQVPR